MDTLILDLLFLIDKHTDAKSSALLSISTNFKLFSDGYELFDISQPKWLLYAINNNRDANNGIEDDLRKQLDYETLDFMVKNKCFTFLTTQQYDFDVKFIKESKIKDVLENPVNFLLYLDDVYGLQKIIRAYIRRDCVEMVKTLMPIIIDIYGSYTYNIGDYPPPAQPHIITILLTKAYKYKSLQCIEYLEELYDQMGPIGIDKYFVLIELLSYDVYNERIIQLLSLLKLETNIDIDYLNITLEYAVVYCKCKKAVYHLLNMMREGINLHDKPAPVIPGQICRTSLHNWFKFALEYDDKKLLNSVVDFVLKSQNTENISDIFFEALYAENFDICDIILNNSNWMIEEFQYRVSNIRMPPEFLEYVNKEDNSSDSNDSEDNEEYPNDSEDNGEEHSNNSGSDKEEENLAGSEFGRFLHNKRCIEIENMTTNIFDYIISKCVCNFDVDYILFRSHQYLNYRLFKRVLEFKNDMCIKKKLFFF